MVRWSKIRVAGALAISALFAMPAPVFAQQDNITTAAEKFYATCRTRQQGSVEECACVTGFFAGTAKEDEFRMMSVITPFIAPNGEVIDMDGAVAAARAEQKEQGLSDARFGEIMQMLTTMGERGAYGDRICRPVALKAQKE